MKGNQVNRVHPSLLPAAAISRSASSFSNSRPYLRAKSPGRGIIRPAPVGSGTTENSQFGQMFGQDSARMTK